MKPAITNRRIPGARTAVALATLAGGVAGAILSARTVQASDCGVTDWTIELESVTSSDPSVDHSSYWPDTARLTISDRISIIHNERGTETVSAVDSEEL